MNPAKYVGEHIPSAWRELIVCARRLMWHITWPDAGVGKLVGNCWRHQRLQPIGQSLGRSSTLFTCWRFSSFWEPLFYPILSRIRSAKSPRNFCRVIARKSLSISQFRGMNARWIVRLIKLTNLREFSYYSRVIISRLWEQMFAF